MYRYYAIIGLRCEAMMKPKHTYRIDPELDTLFIAKKARDHQLKDHDVVNATLGSFYDEDKNFYHFHAVEEAIQHITTEYPYTPTEGVLGVSERWLDRLSQTPLTIPHASVLTNGGTGALYLALDSYVTDKDCVVTPIPTWNNNYAMVDHLHISLYTFEGYQKGSFDIPLLKDTLTRALSHHEKVMVLLNDPAHNPTGYSFSEDTWKDILSLLHAFGMPNRILLMIDMAYIDFAELSYNPFQLFQTYAHTLTILFAVSGSKSYSLYGARAGMLVCMSNDTEDVIRFKEAVIYSARATYSLPSSFPAKVIDYLHQQSLDAYTEELSHLKVMLKERSERLTHILDTLHIPYFTYHHGFFITIKDSDPHTRFKAFETHGIYTIPVEGGIRLAVSSLNAKDFSRIEEILKAIYREVTKT